MFNPNNRKRAIERLKEHRNEERIRNLKETELKRMENESFSLLWKTKMKESINGSVEKQIDKQILNDAIKHHAELLEFSSDRLEEAWSELVTGLRVPSRLDLLVDHLSIANPSESIPAAGSGSPTMAESFLKLTMPQDELDTLKMSQQVGLSYLSSIGGGNPPATDFAQSSLLGRFANTKEAMGDPNRLIRSVFLVGPSAESVEHTMLAQGFSSPPLSANQSADFSSVSNAGLDHQRSSSGSNPGGNGNGKAVVDPCMLFKTTLDEGLDQTLLAQLCFPTGIDVSVKAEQRRSNASMASSLSMGLKTPRRDSLRGVAEMKTRQFVFVLTDGHNQNQFAVCTIMPRRFVEEGGVVVQTEYCLCVVTAYPYLNYFLHLSNQFDAMDGLKLNSALAIQDDNSPLQMELRHLNELAIKLNRCLLPEPGGTLQFVLSVRQNRVDLGLRRLFLGDADAEAQYHALLWALPVLLRHLPLQEILLALGCMCGEMSVLVTGGDASSVTAVIIALIFLLRPLRWAGNIISVLPPSMDGYLDSPVMYIYGMPKCPPHHEVQAGSIKVDLLERAVELHGSEAVVSNTLTLPQASKLKELLRRPAESIEKASRRRRNVRVGGTEYATQTPAAAQAQSPDTAPWQLPLPTELDTNTDRSQLLSSSVLSFISIMSTHITNLLIQSVQAHRDAKIRSQLPPTHPNPNPASKARASYLKLSDLQQPSSRAHSSSFMTDSTDSSVCTDAEDIMQLMANSNIYSKLNPHPLKIQGEGATMKFLNKLRETQMFSFYYSSKAQTVRQNKDKEEAQADSHVGGGGDHSSHSTMPQTNSGSTPPGKGVAGSSATPTAADTPVSSPPVADGSHGVGDAVSASARATAISPPGTSKSPGQSSPDGAHAQKKDPVVDLFSIVLSGSMPMSPDLVESLRKSYEGGEYPEGCGRFKSGNKHLRGSKMARTSRSGSPVSVSLGGVGGVGGLSIEDMEVSDMEGSSGGSDSDGGSDGGGLVWCNGYCGGLANTSTCTLLCLRLWKSRVSFLRKQQIVRHIITKHQNLDIVPEQVQLPDGHVVTTLPKLEPKRHGRETTSQYEKRKLINHTAHQPPRKARKSGNSCLDTLTRYYLDKKQRQYKICRVRALLALKPIMMKLRLRVWMSNRIRATVVIQSLARGYVVRCNIEYVVSILETRKTLRLMACLIIRNWLRELLSRRPAPVKRRPRTSGGAKADSSKTATPVIPPSTSVLGGRRATMSGSSGFLGRNKGSTFLAGEVGSPVLPTAGTPMTATGSGSGSGKKSPLRPRFHSEVSDNQGTSSPLRSRTGAGQGQSQGQSDTAAAPAPSMTRYSTMQPVGERTASTASLHTLSGKYGAGAGVAPSGSRANPGALAGEEAKPRSVRPNTLVTGKRVSMSSMSGTKPLSALNYSNSASALARHATMMADGSIGHSPSEVVKPSRTAMSPTRGSVIKQQQGAKHPTQTAAVPAAAAVAATAEPLVSHPAIAVAITPATRDAQTGATSKHGTPTANSSAAQKTISPAATMNATTSTELRNSTGADTTKEPIAAETPPVVVPSGADSVSTTSPPAALPHILSGISQVSSYGSNSSSNSSSAENSRNNSEDPINAVAANTTVTSAVPERQQPRESTETIQGGDVARGSTKESQTRPGPTTTEASPASPDPVSAARVAGEFARGFRESNASPSEAVLAQHQERRQHVRSMSMTSVDGADTINSDIEYPPALQASLGEAGRTELTNQQRQIVLKMYDMLRAGVEVIKHSKTGNPKLRKLFCDVDMTRLYWREEKGTAADIDRKMKQKRRTSLFNKNDSERELLFADIKEVELFGMSCLELFGMSCLELFGMSCLELFGMSCLALLSFTYGVVCCNMVYIYRCTLIFRQTYCNAQ